MMIRVLHLINSLDVGGGERFAVELVDRLDRERFEARVVCLYGAGDLQERLDPARIPVEVLGLARNLTTSGWARVWRTLRTAQPHIVHAHLPEACWYGLPAGRFAGVPVRIGHVQNTHPRWATKVRLLDRVTSTFATRMIACSEAVRQFCEAGVGYRPGKTRVIHNAIDTRSYHNIASRDEARQRLDLPLGCPILVCVASLTDQKGHIDLLRAMAHIRVAFPEAILLLVGQGPLEGSLMRLSRTLSISDGVRFLGARNDVPLILAASDVFLLASLWEGFGLVLAEAGAAGLPTVATRVDGIREVISEGVTGLLVDPGTPQRLADAVIALLKSPWRSHAMGLRARERVFEHFDIDVAVGKIEDLYAAAVRGADVA